MQLVKHGRNSQLVLMNQGNYQQWKLMVLAHKQTIQKGPINMKRMKFENRTYLNDFSELDVAIARWTWRHLRWSVYGRD